MYIADFARKTPEKPAYIMANSGEVVTYRQLDERSNQGAHLLRSLGLKTGDHIAIFMENNARYLEICWAAERSGLYYTAISSRLTASEVDYIVTDCNAQVFITSAEKEPVARELARMMSGVRHRLMVDGAAESYASWEEATAGQPATPLPDETAGRDMLYSSGTTGRPKGIKVPLSGKHPSEPTPLVGLVQHFYGFSDETVYLSPAPLYHAAPLRFNMGLLALGGTSIIMEHFDPEQALQLIEKYRATHSQWVPTMFVRLLKLPEEARRKHDLSSLRIAIHAAAPCPVPVKEQMIDWWGKVIYEYYGGTEGNGLCAVGPEEWLTHKGSVGKPILGEVHIVGEDGEEVPAGEEGTVYFGSGPRFEYHNDQEKTRSAYNEKGWSTLGDVGRLDGEGYLYLTDRKAFMIISGGVNIYPQEAENVLITHPKVQDVAVIGVPNEDFGEEVKAVVQPIDMRDAGPELERELIAYCRARIADIKCPRSIDFEQELPRHPTGKLYKRLLKDRYWGKHETRIV